MPTEAYPEVANYGSAGVNAVMAATSLGIAIWAFRRDMPFFDGISNKALGAGASVFAAGFGFLTYAEWKSYREWRKSLAP